MDGLTSAVREAVDMLVLASIAEYFFIALAGCAIAWLVYQGALRMTPMDRHHDERED